ncbi:hypothetical protein ACQQ2N_00765 [Dokdonella sp. MW10]|uniref:hypothetical protein n=1 Tax=Dokdonella sp. MW10 TaxID=2992926 RepID=UPI003F808B19
MSLEDLPFPLPPFYFPTRVLHVDDHARYLELLPPLLGPRVHLDSYTSAREALRAARLSTERESPVADLIFRQRGDASRVILDVAGIHRIAYDADRFSEISVAVVDWHMPEMNGMEFLQQLPLQNVGRILLTGRAALPTAVDAFNRGLIDRFIEKGSPTVVEELREAILQLQWSYFRRSFGTLAETLAIGDYPMLRDPDVVGVLEDGFISICPVEMYVHDVPRGLLFLDDLGRAEFVVVMTPAELYEHAERAADIGAPETMQRALRDGTSIPVFARGNPGFDARQPLDSSRLVPATFVRGTTGDYFLGKLRDLQQFRIKIPAITPYDTWLQRNELPPAE